MSKIYRKPFVKYIINEIIKKRLFRLLSDRQFILIEYLFYIGKICNLKDPKTFSEKIQWIKLNGGLDEYAYYADKFTVRQYIKDNMGDNYLVPLIGAYDNFNEINFDQLPQKFVVKASHGSAYVHICHDKETLNMPLLKKAVNKWLRENFYTKTRELQYKNCKPKIIVEAYLENDNNNLIDYKFFCYNGHPEFVEVVGGRFSENKFDVIMSKEWKQLNITYYGETFKEIEIEKPDTFSKMLTIASKLSKDFPFVRVDLYSVEGKIYFGELTFTPASGMARFVPESADLLFGEKLDLKKYRVLPLNNVSVSPLCEYQQI